MQAAGRTFRQSQVDTAVRFCAKVFGPQYPLLRKAAEVVVNSGRKAAGKA
jgi:hypothetical protein